jgi:polysaccharide biosynthesis protein PslH
VTQQRTAPARPQLLYLSPVVPATSGNGLAMRAGMVLEILSRHYSVSLLVVRRYLPYDGPLPVAMERLCSRVVLVRADHTPLKPSLTWRRPLLRAFTRAQSGRSPLSRSPIEEASKAFASLPFDVVHVFRMAMLPFARPYLDVPGQPPKRHLDLDDIESVTHERLAGLYRLNGHSERARVEEAAAERARVLETEILQSFDRLYVCSESDRANLGNRSRAQVCVLPNALPLPGPLPPKRDGGKFTFLFVGTLGYYPNEDAVLHFCVEVLPLIRRAARQAFQIVIVGTGATPALRRLVDLPEVELIGAVPDVAPWYSQADAAIVPVRAGGGTRIKVLEAFSYACPVVSTSVGMEGIAARAGEHVLVGDTPAALAEQCLRLMTDQALADRLTSSAAALLRRDYTPEAAARRLEACF